MFLWSSSQPVRKLSQRWWRALLRPLRASCANMKRLGGRRGSSRRAQRLGSALTQEVCYWCLEPHAEPRKHSSCTESSLPAQQSRAGFRWHFPPSLKGGAPDCFLLTQAVYLLLIIEAEWKGNSSLVKSFQRFYFRSQLPKKILSYSKGFLLIFFQCLWHVLCSFFSIAILHIKIRFPGKYKTAFSLRVFLKSAFSGCMECGSSTSVWGMLISEKSTEKWALKCVHALGEGEIGSAHNQFNYVWEGQFLLTHPALRFC